MLWIIMGLDPGGAGSISGVLRWFLGRTWRYLLFYPRLCKRARRLPQQPPCLYSQHAPRELMRPYPGRDGQPLQHLQWLAWCRTRARRDDNLTAPCVNLQRIAAFMMGGHHSKDPGDAQRLFEACTLRGGNQRCHARCGTPQLCEPIDAVLEGANASSVRSSSRKDRGRVCHKLRGLGG